VGDGDGDGVGFGLAACTGTATALSASDNTAAASIPGAHLSPGERSRTRRVMPSISSTLSTGPHAP